MGTARACNPVRRPEGRLLVGGAVPVRCFPTPAATPVTRGTWCTGNAGSESGHSVRRIPPLGGCAVLLLSVFVESEGIPQCRPVAVCQKTAQSPSLLFFLRVLKKWCKPSPQHCSPRCPAPSACEGWQDGKARGSERPCAGTRKPRRPDGLPGLFGVGVLHLRLRESPMRRP